jgi:hypothetical protein
MEPVQNTNRGKLPEVRIDRDLDKFEDVVLFPDKLNKAKVLIKKAGLPETKTRRRR